uniref:Protein krueppel n=1 Tax=Anopheles farauti TaxID=69004 RepID=A0A182R0W7_9DIPT
MEIVREHVRTERLKTCQTCRFCLAQDTRLSSIFSTQDQNRVAAPLAMQIMSCVGIEVYKEDGMPGMICDNCRLLMSYCYQFKQMCNAADTQLKTFLSTGIWPKKLAIANELQALLPNLKQTPVQTKKSPTAATAVQSKKPEPADTEQEKKHNVIKLSPADLKNFKQTHKISPVATKPTLPTEKANISASGMPLMTSTPMVKRAPLPAQVKAGIEVLKANGQKQKEKPPIILNNLVNSSTPKVAEEFISTGDGTVEMVLSYENPDSGVPMVVATEAEPTEAKEENVYPCKECTRTFPLKQLLDIHQLIHRRERNHPCDQCDKRFLSKYDLAKHYVTHTGDRPYVCVICRASFSRSTLLTRHQAKHKDELRYVCSVCDRQFLSQDELTKHMEIHDKNRPFKCSYCPKSFAYKQGMERHEVVHQDKLPFQCEYCEESFLTSGKLLRHLTKHAGDRPYPCRQCNKSFLLSHHLSRHVRSHSGTSTQHQYQCNACGAIFEQMESYVKHSQEHAKHNGQCPLCNEHVGDTQTIAEHMKTHNTERHPCDYCDLMFTSQKKLNDHCQEVHRNELAYERPEAGQQEEDEDEEEDEKRLNKAKADSEQADLGGLVLNYGELQEEELIDDGLFLEDESTLVPDPLCENVTFETTEIEVRAPSPIETKPAIATISPTAATAVPTSSATVAKAGPTTKPVSSPTKSQTTKVPQGGEQTKTPRQQRMQEFFKRNQLAAEKKVAQQQQSVSDMIKHLPKGVTIKPRVSTVPPQIKEEPEEKQITETVPPSAPKMSGVSANVPVKRNPGRPPKIPKPAQQKESATAPGTATLKKEDSKPKPKPPIHPPVVESRQPIERKELKRSASALVISKPRTITTMPEERENAATAAGTKPTKSAAQPPPPAPSSWMIKRSYAPKVSEQSAMQGKKRPAEPDTDQPAPSKRPALSRKTLNPSMLRPSATGGKQTETSQKTSGGDGTATTVAAAGNMKRIAKPIGTPVEVNIGGRTIKVQKITKEQAIALSGLTKSKTVG